MLCRAQDTAGQNPSLRTQANVVLVPALVKDKTDRPVFGLQARDFIIEDYGVEQKVNMDEAEPQEAVSQNPIEFFCSGVLRPVSYPNSRLIRRLLKRVAGPGTRGRFYL